MEKKNIMNKKQSKIYKSLWWKLPIRLFGMRWASSDIGVVFFRFSCSSTTLSAFMFFVSLILSFALDDDGDEVQLNATMYDKRALWNQNEASRSREKINNEKEKHLAQHKTQNKNTQLKNKTTVGDRKPKKNTINR